MDVMSAMMGGVIGAMAGAALGLFGSGGEERKLLNRLREAKKRGVPLVVLVRKDRSASILLPSSSYHGVVVFRDPRVAIPRIVVADKVYSIPGGLKLIFVVEPALRTPSPEAIAATVEDPLAYMRQLALAIRALLASGVVPEENRGQVEELLNRLEKGDRSVWPVAIRFAAEQNLHLETADPAALAEMITRGDDMTRAWMYAWERAAGRVMAIAGLQEAMGKTDWLKWIIVGIIAVAALFVIWQFLGAGGGGVIIP